MQISSSPVFGTIRVLEVYKVVANGMPKLVHGLVAKVTVCGIDASINALQKDI